MLRSRFTTLILFCGLLGTLLPRPLNAQTPVKPPEVRYGEVNAADFVLQPIPADTTAEAVVLYESASTRYEYRDLKVIKITDFYSRIRINKKSAYDQATVQIPLRGSGGSGSDDLVFGLDGVTYTLQSGQVTKQKMDKAAVARERVSNQFTMQKFTLPGVQEGCIIEYRYTVRSPNDVTPPAWQFQQSIPVVWSDYKVTISNYYFFKVILSGYRPLTHYNAKAVSFNLLPSLNAEGAVEFHYAMANVPAFRSEPFITTAKDYVSRLEFELSSVNIPGYVSESYSLNWADMDRTLLANEAFSGQYKKAPYLREATEAIKAKYPAADTLGRVVAAYNHVRNTMTWNEENNLQSDRLKKVLELKKGDAADLNFMLIGMLRDLGLDANPLILSTRNHGRLNQQYGLLRQFNYVVGHLTLGGTDFLLDATDRFIKPGMLPRRVLNGAGRLILPNNQSRFVNTTPTERDVEAKTGAFVLTEEGEVKGTLTHSYGGYAAADARESHKLQGETNFVDDVKRKKPSWEITGAEVRDVANPAMPLTVNYTLTVPEAAQVAGERLYLRPLLTEGEAENPFKQTERQFPVDFAVPFDESFTAAYTLPAGYVADELPKPLALSLPNNGGRFTYQVQQQENRLLVTSRVSVKKAVFTADEYAFLKEFYEKIMLKHGEQVVLKKGASVADKK